MPLSCSTSEVGAMSYIYSPTITIMVNAPQNAYILYFPLEIPIAQARQVELDIASSKMNRSIQQLSLTIYCRSAISGTISCKTLVTKGDDTQLSLDTFRGKAPVLISFPQQAQGPT